MNKYVRLIKTSGKKTTNVGFSNEQKNGHCLCDELPTAPQHFNFCFVCRLHLKKIYNDLIYFPQSFYNTKLFNLIYFQHVWDCFLAESFIPACRCQVTDGKQSVT